MRCDEEVGGGEEEEEVRLGCRVKREPTHRRVVGKRIISDSNSTKIPDFSKQWSRLYQEHMKFGTLGPDLNCYKFSKSENRVLML